LANPASIIALLRRVRRLTMGALKRTVPDEVPEAVLAFMRANQRR